MVVVDYSVHDRLRRNDQDDQRQRLLLDEDASVDIAMANFCPRLREAVSLLSRHKVGPLQQQVRLSDFQSSTTSSLLLDCLSSNTHPPRNDRFVLALPYLCDEILAASGHNYMVQWSIIAQCGSPDKAPEVILLGMYDSSIVLGYGEATLRRTHNNQRSQNTHRRQCQTQIFQERYWQQYVASDVFHIKCLTNWNKINNDKSLLQYCLLADQLYECYAQFQVYKLKMSLKSMPSMIQPSSQLIQAYTQYKQLTKLSKLSGAKLDTATTEINVELYTDLENGINAKDYEDRRNQTTSSALVFIRAIISMVSCEQTTSTLPITDHHIGEKKALIQLASVSAIFPPAVISAGSFGKNATTPGNTSGSSNKKYSVKTLNPKLGHTTHQGAMMTLLMDGTAEQLETTIDFVTYVCRVKHVAFQAYNHKFSGGEEGKLSPVDNDDNSVQLLLESLFEVFCDPISNGNSLIDYQISNHDPTTKNTTCFIRFLLVDGDLVTETTQLKYILTIKYSKEVFKEFKSTSDTEDSTRLKKLVPVIALRSVYDDENCEHNLNINIADIVNETDKQKYNKELATIIKIAALDGIRLLRHEVVTPILTRYNKQWSPTDSYFAASSAKPPPYPL